MSSLLIQKNGEDKSLGKIVLIGMFLTAFSTAFLPKSLTSIVFTILLLVLFFTSDFYLALPILLFFYSYLSVPFINVSVYRIFTLLLFVELFIKKTSIEMGDSLLILSIYSLYILSSIAFVSIQRALLLLFDIVVVVIYALDFLRKRQDKEERIKKFFVVFVIAAIIAYPYGVITNNFIDYTSQEDRMMSFMRYMATFEDPNYMGFFFSVAIFSTVTQKLFSKRMRVIVVIYLEICLLGSISITAIIGNIIFWILYLIFTGKLKGKYIVIMFVVAFAIVVTYQIALNYGSMGMLSQVAKRVQEKLNLLVAGDINAVTTGRQNILQRHFEFFWNQDSIIKILFGGNIVNAKITVSDIFKNVTHNEYVTWLINVGLVGAILLFAYIIYKLVVRFKEYKKKNELSALTFLMTRCIWMFYAMTLTLFMDERFFLFFLL